MVGLPLPYQIGGGYLAMTLNGNRLTVDASPVCRGSALWPQANGRWGGDADEILEIYRSLPNCRVHMEPDFGASRRVLAKCPGHSKTCKMVKIWLEREGLLGWPHVALRKVWLGCLAHSETWDILVLQSVGIWAEDVKPLVTPCKAARRCNSRVRPRTFGHWREGMQWSIWSKE